MHGPSRILPRWLHSHFPFQTNELKILNIKLWLFRLVVLNLGAMGDRCPFRRFRIGGLMIRGAMALTLIRCHNVMVVFF